MSQRAHERRDTPARLEAARVLWDARRAGPDREERIEWACALLDDRRHPCRLRARLLLDAGHPEAADATLARGLLREPDHPSLVTLRAESLLARGEVERANDAIALALVARPHHAHALSVAARVARRRGALDDAAAYMERARRRRPADRALVLLHVEVLLELGAVDDAARALDDLPHAPAVLHARVLRATGRLADAIERLESEPVLDDAALVDLIDLQEACGRHDHLAQRLRAVGPGTPRALLRAGEAWLRLGTFRTAVVRLAPLRRATAWRDDALAIMMVAAAQAGRPRLAERLLARLDDEGRLDPRRNADLWRRADLGAILASAHRTGAPPAPTPRGLAALAARALDAFEAEGGEIDPADRRHRAACLAVLGRRRELTRRGPIPRARPLRVA